MTKLVGIFTDQLQMTSVTRYPWLITDVHMPPLLEYPWMAKLLRISTYHPWMTKSLGINIHGSSIDIPSNLVIHL